LTWEEPGPYAELTQCIVEKENDDVFFEIKRVLATVKKYIDTDVEPETIYSYRVKCTNGTIDSNYVTEIATTTSIPEPSLEATFLVNYSVELNWTHPVPDIEKCRVVRHIKFSSTEEAEEVYYGHEK